MQRRKVAKEDSGCLALFSVPSMPLCFPFFPLKNSLEHSLALYSCSCTIALPYSSSLMSATAVLCLAT